MDKHCVHQTSGRTCASEISFDFVEGRIYNVQFVNGCRGNTQGVAALAEGQLASEVVRRLKGIDCHGGNSCPNELATAIDNLLREMPHSGPDMNT